MESRPFLTRVPDPSVIVGDTLAAGEHLQATRDADGSYAMVYSPSGRPLKVRMDKVTGQKVKVWWFNPRTGDSTALGEFANAGEREFTPATRGEGNDWAVVLDDASKNFSSPGLAKDTSGSVRPETSAGRFKTIQVGTRPESVTKGFGGHYYVTVMGDQPPGDAVIKVIKGEQVEVFATGMDEPKGIAFVGGFLVTTDLKRVWKIDAQGNKTVLANYGFTSSSRPRAGPSVRRRTGRVADTVPSFSPVSKSATSLAALTGNRSSSALGSVSS